MAPSFVTCPTMNVGIPLFFAMIMSRMADSLTWVTLPGAEVRSLLNMV